MFFTSIDSQNKMNRLPSCRSLLFVNGYRLHDKSKLRQVIFFYERVKSYLSRKLISDYLRLNNLFDRIIKIFNTARR